MRRAAASKRLVSSDAEGDDLLGQLAVALQPCADRFFDGLRTSSYDGALDAATAVRLASLLRYATGVVPLDVYQVEFGKVGTPSTLIEDLNAALTKTIEELTRPVDAIKHQAKTVTVGISRSDETLLQVPLVQELLTTGAPRDSLTYRALRTVVALDPAVDAVVGWTRYRIDGDPSRGGATIEVVDSGGIARDIPSRTADNPTLRGTKHRAASEREVTVVRGRADGRTLVIIPEIKGNQATGLTLLHVRFHDRLPAEVARRVLEGYRDRYEAIADQVTEVEPVMRDDVLASIDLVELLTRRSCSWPIVGGPSGGAAMTDASMPAWTVAAPGADRRGPLRRVTRRSPGARPRRGARPRARRAGCAAPISTSPRAISRRGTRSGARARGRGPRRRARRRRGAIRAR